MKSFIAIILFSFFSGIFLPVWAEIPDEAYQTLIGQLRSKQFEEGYKTAKYYADRGSIKAYVILGQMHLNGDFVAKDKMRGKYYLQLASDNGNGYASSELSLLAGNEVDAFGYQHRGAQQGNVNAVVGLMFSYFHGKGTAQNDLLAAKWINAKTLMTPSTNEEIEDVRATLTNRLSNNDMDTAWSMAWNFVYLRCKCGWNQEDFEVDNPAIALDQYYLSDEFRVVGDVLKIHPQESSQ